MYIVASAAGNPKGRRMAWVFFQERFSVLRSMLDGSGFLLGRLVCPRPSFSAPNLDFLRRRPATEFGCRPDSDEELTFCCGRMQLSLSTASLASRKDAEAVEAFFAAHDMPALKRTVSQCAEKIRCNAGWLERDGDAVAAWVRERAA